MAYLRRMRSLILATATAGLLLAGCEKDQQTGVPPTPVDISININLPEYFDLQAPGGWVYLTGGSRGLVVYRKSQDEFIAFDRHCPYQPENGCRVFVDQSSVIARDSLCCHSAFLLLDGSVTEGPSSFALKHYNTLFNGTTLRIYS